jgi:hypothetical protein
MSATGWSERTVYRKEIKTRDGKKGSNGKPLKQYAASSLPAEVQSTLFRQRLASEALVIASRSPHHIAPKLPTGPDERERIDLGPEAYAQAELRLKIIGPMIDFVNNTNGHKPVFKNGSGQEICTLCGVVDHIAAIQQVSTATLWDWYGRYKKQGFAALADRVRSDAGKSRYFSKHPQVDAFAQNKFLNEKLSIKLVHEAIVRNWPRLRNDESDQPPSYEVLRTFLNAIPPILSAVARKGEKAFNNDFAPFIIRNIEAKRPNEIWVSDHMVHDVWVRNDGVFGELKENEAFRPWLTCIVDMRSRKVLGTAWCVNPSSRSISSALRVAMCRFGLPQVFYIDNGKDYQKVGKEVPGLSPEASGILFRLNVKSQHCLPLHPQSKQIESFFRTLHQRFDVIWSPFYCGISPAKRPEQCDQVLRDHKKLVAAGQGDKSPLPAASEFIQLAARWTDEFNATFPHSGQGMNGHTPNQVFEAELPSDQLHPINPADVAELFWDRQKRMVREGGTIELNNARYEPANAETFAAMACQIKREILVACDPLNVGEAIALSIDGNFLGQLRAQELLIHGATSQDEIQASLKTRRRMLKATKQYLATLESSRVLAGDSTEIEDLRRRAVASCSKPTIHALPVLKAVNAPEPRLHVDDIVDSFLEETQP